MASRGLHEFTVQEARNFAAFGSWNYENITGIADDTNYHSSTYITAGTPAKKVVIYMEPGDTASIDSNDVITIKINGETATGKEVKIDAGDLPFTLTGLTITSLALKTDDANSGEALSVLSFH
tara:strand:+ start:499 stop:867 length:369 start_codon:yes stop_codon:yes gene_type:complete